MTADVRAAVSDATPQGVHAARAPDTARVRAPVPVEAADPPALLASLRQLMHLRGIAIVGQTTAIALALALGMALPTVSMAAIVGALVALNVAAAARVRRGTPTTHREVSVHLLLDLAAFTALLLLAGGTANPFTLAYLLHVVLIAMLLPWVLALAGTALVVASFGLAFAFSEPLRLADGRPLPDAAMALGLWASFTLTAAVTAWFVVRIAAALREHDRLLREAARRTLNDEAVLRIGTLAAGAAHELGNPLTTMTVVVGEMRREADTPERRRDVAILAAQIEACTHALANLRAVAGHARAEDAGRARLDAFLAATVTRFQSMRPDVTLAARWDGPAEVPEICADESLRQAILMLLNNAADASPEHVDVEARWDHESLHMTVGDRGTGVPAGTLERLGRAFFTTKPPGKGTGLGLVLTASAVDRLGGTVRWSNRPGGGLVAEIRVPLNGLTQPVTTR